MFCHLKAIANCPLAAWERLNMEALSWKLDGLSSVSILIVSMQLLTHLNRQRHNGGHSKAMTQSFSLSSSSFSSVASALCLFFCF